MKEEFTTQARRWYDQDPVLSSAMQTLEESGDDTQIKIALNLIKIITEHNIERFALLLQSDNCVGCDKECSIRKPLLLRQ